MKKSRRYQPAIRGIVGGVVLVAALAAFLGPSQSEAGIEQRAAAFWEARIQGDHLTAYQYEANARTGKMTATQYVQSRSSQLTYIGYTIEEIQEQENAAQVKIAIKCQLAIPGIADIRLDEVIEERWTRLDDGQWYRNNRRDKRKARQGRTSAGLNICLTGCGIFIMVLSNHATRGKPKGNIDVRAGPARAT